ncbi:hypothetical protein SBV1_950006 [Verrucomicrobia bacterium]|nr:hypothetical protein SBV1_950006 [Verrucomicrobiota bacterium]
MLSGLCYLCLLLGGNGELLSGLCYLCLLLLNSGLHRFAPGRFSDLNRR